MESSSWPEVLEAIDAAPYPVRVLPADPQRCAACAAEFEVTTRSWLGALVANAGGLLVDHGWVRVLGAGHEGLPDIVSQADRDARILTIAYDVTPTVHYFGPDDLGWQDLEQGYADWLNAVLRGSLTRFYETLRWPGWESDTEALGLDEGFSVYPPPFTEEGRDLSTVSRSTVPLDQLVSFYQDAARQLDGQPDY
jgi:hypothetical protein